MAYANTHIQSSPVLHALAAPFAAFGRLILRMCASSGYMQKVEALNAMTDADLAALNTTRRAEVERIFAVHMHS